MKGNVLVILLAISLAILTTFAQIDQEARLSPSYSFLVPDRFSGNSARERSKLALTMGNPELALAEARQQAALRPMPAESLTVLALAALRAEEADTARQALEAASRRGWREPISQVASAEAALDQGKLTIASRRIVALLSTGNLTEPALAMMARLVALPEGREEMASRMASFGRWQSATLTSAAGFADPDQWAHTVALAGEKGADLPCNRLELLSARYQRTGYPEAAALVGSVTCKK